MKRSRWICWRWTHWAATSVVIGVSMTFGAAAAVAGTGRNTDGALVLGSLAPETGELAPILDSLRTPVRVAVDEINAAGGIGGSPVTLLTGDEDSDAATARRAVDTMLGAGADGVIGPASSTTALEILKTTKGRALVCSGSNSAAALTSQGPRRSGGLYFRTSPPDRFEGPALAERILADGHRRVAVIARDDASGDLLATTLERALRDGGTKVPAVVRHDADGSDASARVRKALAAKPDAVAIEGSADDGAAVLRALVAAGAGPQRLPVYGTDGLLSSRLGALVDPANPGVVAGLAGVAPASVPADVASPFHEALTATGVEPAFSAHVYDCTILTALAAVKAKSDDPKKMAKVFASNLKGANDCDTFATCRDLLDAGKTIHWRGASSSFDRFGKFEPNEGVYQPWVYDLVGNPRDGDPSTQITIA